LLSSLSFLSENAYSAEALGSRLKKKSKKPEKNVGFFEFQIQAILRRMNLAQYFSEEPRGAKIEMAQYLGISAEWMSKIIHGKVKPGAALCYKIEKATQGLVTRRELRPDLFA
jgi:DNA-binding XRE family transcriptional regulator